MKHSISAFLLFLAGLTIPLESIAATFTVTVNAGTGAGSLAAAITSANGAAGADIIVFDPALVSPIMTGALPDITDQVTINGASWSLANGGGKIALTLSKAAPGNYTSNLRFINAASAGSSLRNVALSGGQVYMENTNNIIVINSYFQLSSTGLAAGGGNINPANSINILNCNTITISNNYFGNRTGISYHLFTNNGDNMNIQNNNFGFFSNGSNHTTVIGGGVFLTNGSADGNVSNNVFGNLSGTVVNIDNSANAIINNNILGLAANGTTNAAITLASHGIYLNLSNGSTISNNLVANVPRNGLSVSSSTNVTVTGNRVGINGNGTCAPAVWAGLSMSSVTSSTISNNIFRCNTNLNVYFASSSTISFTGNTVANAGAAGSYGIYFELGNTQISINGGNVITGNGTGGGVNLLNNASPNSRITITNNSIYCNGNASNDGIILGAGSNEGIAAPSISVFGANTTSGTGAAGNTIHLYRNVTNTGIPCQDCEGEIYIGTTTVGGGGGWSITHNLNLTGGSELAVSATQTNTNGSTSRFSTCTAPPLPVELISFTGKLIADGVLLNWTTASERNNKGFVIERSSDGKEFYEIGFLKGNHTVNSLSDYTFTDTDIRQALYYYRLKQEDLDGAYSYSKIIKINAGKGCSAELYPNPAKDGNSKLFIFSETSNEVEIEIFTSHGVIVRTSKIIISAGTNEFPIVLPAGYYLVKIIMQEDIIVKPLVVN